MKKYCKITPEGTRDLLFEECLTYRNIEKLLAGVFQSRGFHEVITPGLEYYDVFSQGESSIPQEFMFKVTDNKGRLMVVRPDSTLPIARLTATRLQNELKPLRLFYTQKVYHNYPSLRGRNNEINQSGIELLGASGVRADLEVLSTAVEALSRCVPDYRIELGHAGFFRALAKELPIDDEVRETIRSSIEQKNYAALDTILDRLEQSQAVLAIRRLPRLFGGEEVFDEAFGLCSEIQEAQEPLEYLKGLYQKLAKLGMGNKLMIDLGIVHRNDYYSGIVFSGYVLGSGDAILSGGRYDRLLEAFDSPMPAIGFAIDINVLTKLMMDRGNLPSQKSADVLIHGDDGYEIKALDYSNSMKMSGLCCENSVLQTREAAVDYAKTKKIPRVDFVGAEIETKLL